MKIKEITPEEADALFAAGAPVYYWGLTYLKDTPDHWVAWHHSWELSLPSECNTVWSGVQEYMDRRARSGINSWFGVEVYDE